MAQNLVVNFIGNNRLSKTTSVISNDLKKMGQTTDKVSRGMSRALGALGVGFGLAQLSSALKQASKDAIEDSKSQALLALALKNTVGATEGAIAGAEEYIKKTQLSTAVLDDQLRPALATAVRATGDLASGQELLNVALDVSAGTGKDLGQVTKAIARAQQGQLGGLQRLIPGIQKGTDVMAQLRKQFAGAAEIAANQDPYKRLEVILNEMQETIGKALIPYLQDMAKYLASPEGQRELQKIADTFVEIAKGAGQVISWLVKNVELIKTLIKLYVAMKIGIYANTMAMKLYTLATTGGVAVTKALKFAIASTGIGLLVIAVGELAAAWMDVDNNSKSALQRNRDAYGVKLKNDPFLFDKERADKAFGSRWSNLGAYWRTRLDTLGDTIADGIAEQSKKIAKTAESFRDSVGLAFGVTGEDEYSFFNVDKVIAKLRRVVDAAKGFKERLKMLARQGAGQDVINELIGMGPAQGNIVAKGLLQSGRLSEYLGLRGSLYATGASVAGVAESTGEKTYTININKANVSAADIISEIRKFEKQTNKKYFVN